MLFTVLHWHLTFLCKAWIIKLRKDHTFSEFLGKLKNYKMNFRRPIKKTHTAKCIPGEQDDYMMVMPPFRHFGAEFELNKGHWI